MSVGGFNCKVNIEDISQIRSITVDPESIPVRYFSEKFQAIRIFPFENGGL